MAKIAGHYQTIHELFARVRPLVGTALDSCQVAVVGTPAAADLVAYLVACGVRRWLITADNGWAAALLAKLSDYYGDLLDITCASVTSPAEVAKADLALAVDAVEPACLLPTTLPRLAIFTPTGKHLSRALLALPGETLALPEQVVGPATSAWDWLTAAPLLALWARALLLRAGQYRMATWEDAWMSGMRSYRVGKSQEPTKSTWQVRLDAEETQELIYRTPPLRQGTLLVVGVGSLGSVAARQLATQVERIVLVDPDRVEVANLVRQAFSHHQLGEWKAVALAQWLGAAEKAPVCEAIVTALTDEEQVGKLIDSFGVTAALVTTGTHADFAIARALRAAAIPHVVGRCYARGRFWEGIVVEGRDGPSYEQVRREVAAGPTPTPTPEELAAYGAGGELASEPATAMETGWAAQWLARLTAQMMAPKALREGWLLARLAAGATCFIGGLVVEQGEQGVAYGVTTPGEIHAWSAVEIQQGSQPVKNGPAMAGTVSNRRRYRRERGPRG